MQCVTERRAQGVNTVGIYYIGVMSPTLMKEV
jgi:hypothetical protein